ncbi:regulatory protein YycI of two-component signal transduction system YycFG [Anaerosolibacter carboniphilus]|uniref:Regulatory protein YycI of two-component signal transduction system YycFG n=1 Tax=Anaerosolibacter carboniphilus TaxID=1417629 RepID=A0A841KM56_9FIRM|nr:two-component system regulatory protein YycI [Anaerosolibacter carboniphilus]MBB6214527.1 regulatory protein YycI of two-component signal transduction system YycFG [Anaerosolibacter carboniphilus]
MDWSKAKNILIIAFIVTNVFLVITIERNLFQEPNLPLPIDKTVQGVIHVMEEKDIHIKTDIPRTMTPMPVLEVEYETYEDEEIARLAYKEKDRDNGPKGQFEVVNDKILIYAADGSSKVGVRIDSKKAQDRAEGFLKYYGFMKNDVDYWRTDFDGESYNVVFKQRYKGTFLEDSYMNIQVTELGDIQYFERVWLRPINLGDSKNEIMPATKALLKAIEKLNEIEGPKTIIDVGVGYRFDPPSMQNAKSGTAFPVWRIALEEGTMIFIDAYENH